MCFVHNTRTGLTIDRPWGLMARMNQIDDSIEASMVSARTGILSANTMVRQMTIISNKLIL